MKTVPANRESASRDEPLSIETDDSYTRVQSRKPRDEFPEAWGMLQTLVVRTILGYAIAARRRRDRQ